VIPRRPERGSTRARRGSYPAASWIPTKVVVPNVRMRRSA
jgi:hypothetical protein